MTGSSVCRDSFTSDSCPWLIHMCDMTHFTRLNHVCGDSCVRHDSFTCVKWLMHTREMTLSYAWDDSLIRMTCPNHMWGDSCVRHDSCTCVTWLMHTREMTLSYVWRAPIIFVTWLILMRDKTIHTCETTHSYVRYYHMCTRMRLCVHVRVLCVWGGWERGCLWMCVCVVCVCVCVCVYVCVCVHVCVCHTHEWQAIVHIMKCEINESCHTRQGVMSHIWMSHVTHIWMTGHTSPKIDDRHVYKADQVGTFMNDVVAV